MLVANINVKKIIDNTRLLLKRKRTVIIIFIITIFILFIISLFTFTKVRGIRNGIIIENIMQKLGIVSKSNLFNMTSYYTEYEMTVCSNKNTNTYVVKEWFKEGIGTKFSFLDSKKNEVDIIINNSTLTIYNEAQKNVFEVEKYMSSFSNLMSIKTFIYMYNIFDSKEESNTCCFRADTYEKNSKLNMVIANVIDEKRECDCSYRYLAEKIYNIKLSVDSEKGIPLTYIITNNNKEQIISIVYNRFDINANIDDNVFKIN